MMALLFAINISQGDDQRRRKKASNAYHTTIKGKVEYLIHTVIKEVS
jgi:hypothetical protein